LFKTFIFGVVLGVAGAAALLYVFPVVDQQREESIVSVAPNGGNVESFHVNVPMDRILVGASANKLQLPAGVQWPSIKVLQDVQVELFKIRNARDAVIGIAARTAGKNGPEEVIDWVLHLPARGSVFVNMRPEAVDGGYRRGELRAGSREFGDLSGFMTERWVPDTSGDEEGPAGRIELVTTFVGKQEAI
jgi:hypothetical protein